MFNSLVSRIWLIEGIIMYIDNKYIFISYCSSDSDFSQKLVDALEGEGLPFWYDKNELKAGDSLLDKIQLAISKAEYFLIIISPNSINSNWVQTELKSAMSKQIEGIERFVIPVMIDHCEIPLFLKDLMYVNFTDERQFEKSFGFLLRSIDSKNVGSVSHASYDKYSDSILEKFSEIFESGDREWFNAFKGMPIIDLFFRSLKYGAFGGRFKNEIVTGLAYVSNSDAATAFNNLVAVLCFLTDASKGHREK